MVHNAEQTAQSAEASTSNAPGFCLEWSRERAAIAPLFPDAATAWRNAFHRHKGDRNPPRGAMCYWLGGSSGYGHIAVSLGGGNIRSTDSGGSGHPATVALAWPEQHWGLTYAGWADNVNDVEIPGVGEPPPEEDDMDLNDPITKWSPDEGGEGETTVGKTLNQARGYAEDAYQRTRALETKVNELSKTVDKILKAVT